MNLLTGFRGNGKSTQLKRLKGLLEQDGCHVVLVDMTQYVLMTKPLDISDFILSLMVALVAEGENEGFGGIVAEYWQQLVQFLNSEVKLDGLNVGTDPVSLALQLKTEPTFKQQLQDALKGHVTTLVKDARAYVVKLVEAIRKRAGDPDKKVVLLVDSMEQIRGVGTEASDVHNSIVNLFSGHAPNLRFDLLHLVYTIPPFLTPLMPNTARNMGGDTVTSWPNIHVRCADGLPDEQGLQIMREIIARRYAGWGQVFSKEQLDRLAAASGGDVRDFFRLIRECLVTCMLAADRLVTDVTLENAESEIRRGLLPIAKDDGRWLAEIHRCKDTALESVAELPRLARFLDSNLIMNYLNGKPWYDIHPLLEQEIGQYPPIPATPVDDAASNTSS